MPIHRIPQLVGMSPLVSENAHVATVIRRDLEMQHVCDAYEAGDVVTFRNLDLGFDDGEWNFINAIVPPASGLENFVKKAKMKHIVAPLSSEHVLCKLGLSLTDAGRLQGIIVRTNRHLYDFAVQCFPNYKFKTVDQGITWRLTVTESEEMHYDNYGTAPIEDHHVRLFVNLDDKPRLWGIGPPVTASMRVYRDRLREHKDLHPNVFNGRLNQALPWLEVQRHYAMFMPGNAWLVNSQLIAHEIIYGRKLIACTFDVDPASMNNPQHSFNARVRAAAAAL